MTVTVNTSTETPRANVDAAELSKFDRIASQWWDENGAFKPLHQMNPVRANYIDLQAQINGKKLLDIGCGGGLLCEAAAQRGALVTGIDLAAQPLSVAMAHAQISGLDITYQNCSAEALAEKSPEAFEVVTCLEMLEHVPDPASVIAACSELVAPGGDVFFSTINRNLKAYAMTILAAEYALKWIPKGTHEYRKFIKPSELSRWARQAGLTLADSAGIIYNPLRQQFSINAHDIDCNYILHFKKPEDSDLQESTNKGYKA